MVHLLLAIIYISFISLGLPDALLGAAWPQMYLDLNTSVSNAGAIFMIISVGTTACSLYFSTLTAYAIVMYDWKLKNAFFTFIMAIMMIPAQITIIGFYQMVYKIHMTNNFLMLILPAIASPSLVFFMRQYMKPALSPSLIESARLL